MSEFKGTPGPWDVMNQTDVFGQLGGDSGDGAVADETDGWQICDCAVGMTKWAGDYTELGYDVRVANAKLISAAPELLEALQETVKDLVAYQVNARHASKINSRWEGCAESVQPSIDKARKAMNKALGVSDE